jgi:hypothetical protein
MAAPEGIPRFSSGPSCMPQAGKSLDFSSLPKLPTHQLITILEPMQNPYSSL